MNPPLFEIGEQVFEDADGTKLEYVVVDIEQEGVLWTYTLKRTDKDYVDEAFKDLRWCRYKRIESRLQPNSPNAFRYFTLKEDV